MLISIVLNSIATIATASLVVTAYFNLNFNHVPEVYVVDMSAPQAKSIMRDHAFFKDPDKLNLSKEDIRCLEYNIFYEAGIEPYYGKIAVAQVTYNRLKTGRWGNTICRVVYARNQFSWTHQNKPKPNGPLWRESQRAARDFINGKRVMNLKDSIYYHATWMERKPFWAHHKVKVQEIGQHVFYRPKN